MLIQFQCALIHVRKLGSDCLNVSQSGWPNQSVQVHHQYRASGSLHQTASVQGQSEKSVKVVGVSQKVVRTEPETGILETPPEQGLRALTGSSWGPGHGQSERRPQEAWARRPAQEPRSRATGHRYSPVQLKAGSNRHSIIPVKSLCKILSLSWVREIRYSCLTE